MLSVICPIYNEERYIGACIESILRQDYPKEDLEVIFADGMSTDRTREIVAGYAASHPFIRLIDNPRRIVPPGLNLALDASTGEVVIRLDAHAAYTVNYFSALVSASKRLDAANVGAPCRTDVLHKTPKALAIREVLSHPLGVGNSAFRLGVEKETEADTVPFGCWQREAFDRFGKFDERLVRNQDIEFNKRILRGGGRIYLIPDTYSTYYAREDYKKLARNNYGNGKWNILTVWYTRQMSSLSLRHFVPLFFVLSVLLPVVIGVLFWAPLMWISLASVVVYLSVVASISLNLAKKKRLSFPHVLATFPILHASYGWGSLMGILRLPFTKR